MKQYAVGQNEITMIKDGKFKRYYVTSTNDDVNMYLTKYNNWSNNFDEACLFANTNEIRETLKDVLVIGYNIVVRSVLCEINGYDLGTLLNEE